MLVSIFDMYFFYLHWSFPDTQFLTLGILDDIFILHMRKKGKLKDYDNNKAMYKQIY